MSRVAIVIDADASMAAQARTLAERLQLPLATLEDANADLLLVRTADRLELRTNGPHRTGPIYVDFTAGRIGHRREAGGLARQLIARAIGFKGSPRHVVDATAGLGRDAFMLACLGCRVTAIERSPIIAALLEDGLRRAATDPDLAPIVQARLRLVEGDAKAVLPRLAAEHTCEVTYIDTMFPQKAKSALAKKEMRICRLVTGDDPDAAELLDIARSCTQSRVVVKRWLRAPALRPDPDITYKGKTIRYDVYLCRRQEAGPAAGPTQA